MVDVQKTWDDFLKSGRVDDYLTYRQEMTVNKTEKVVTQGEAEDAPEHRRNRDKGTEYW